MFGHSTPERRVPKHFKALGASIKTGSGRLTSGFKRRATEEPGHRGITLFCGVQRQSRGGFLQSFRCGINHEVAPKTLRRNMPNPLPVLLLGRMAIDRRYQNKSIGKALLRDAMLRRLVLAGKRAFLPFWFMPSLSRPKVSICHAALGNRHCRRLPS